VNIFLILSGNENIHLLTTSASYRIRLDLMTFDGRWAYAEYSSFWVGPESDNYRLHISGHGGNACIYIYIYILITKPP